MNIDTFTRSKPYWLKISRMALTFMILLIVSSCQKDKNNFLSNGLQEAMSLASASELPGGNYTLYYGHKRFTRDSGAPVTETLVISNPDFEKFDGRFILKIQNGDDKKTRVSSAEIFIDGALVAGSSDFSKNITFISKQLTGLKPESLLEVKLKGAPDSFMELWIVGTLKPVAGSVADIEGNVYKTVVIGTQTWMAENLKVTRFNDNTSIPLVENQTDWAGLSTPGYCWMGNDPNTYKNDYGALYNWYVVDASINGGKNACPDGWHVPVDAEWTILSDFLGGESMAGGKLKEQGINHWFDPNTGATNETGFTALPGNCRNYQATGIFDGVGIAGIWWSATEYEVPSDAWTRFILYNGGGIVRASYYKTWGFSIRCLKDI